MILFLGKAKEKSHPTHWGSPGRGFFQFRYCDSLKPLTSIKVWESGALTNTAPCYRILLGVENVSNTRNTCSSFECCFEKSQITVRNKKVLYSPLNRSSTELRQTKTKEFSRPITTSWDNQRINQRETHFNACRRSQTLGTRRKE